jgi:AcrR family transcriptional regulator
VSLTDIGTAAGITGPSVYGHFASKTDVLVAALQRGSEALWLGVDRTLADTSDPGEALAGLVAKYIAFAVEHTQVLAVLLSEAVHLPEPQRQHFKQLQSDYVTEWVELLAQAQPDLGRHDARLLVHAALSVVNALTLVRGLRSPALAGQCMALACAAMRLSPAGRAA